MESYHGHVRSQIDAILLFEACRRGIIPRIRRRLSERERLQISSGCIYIWDETEAGMRRWTDSKSWSASRVSGPFLTYREMEGVKSQISSNSSTVSDENSSVADSPSSGAGSPPGQRTDESYKYKPGGLYKQSFSITTSTGLKLHLIAYYTKEDVSYGKLIQPMMDPNINQLQIPIDLYPDASAGANAIPAITTAPLGGALPAHTGTMPTHTDAITGHIGGISFHPGIPPTNMIAPYSQTLNPTPLVYPQYIPGRMPILPGTQQFSREATPGSHSVSSPPTPSQEQRPPIFTNAYPSNSSTTSAAQPAEGYSLLPVPMPSGRSNSTDENSSKQQYVQFTEDKRALNVLDKSLYI